MSNDSMASQADDLISNTRQEKLQDQRWGETSVVDEPPLISQPWTLNH